MHGLKVLNQCRMNEDVVGFMYKESIITQSGPAS